MLSVFFSWFVNTLPGSGVAEKPLCFSFFMSNNLVDYVCRVFAKGLLVVSFFYIADEKMLSFLFVIEEKIFDD